MSTSVVMVAGHEVVVGLVNVSPRRTAAAAVLYVDPGLVPLKLP
jgi:hypothetical protein